MDRDDVIDAQIVGESTAIVRVEAAAPAPRSLLDTISPAEKMRLAVEMADALKAMIDAKNKAGRPLSKSIQGKEHLFVEAWQTCGAFVGVSCKVEWTRPVDNGYEARAVVVRMDTGIEVGAGEGLCTRDENRWAKAEDYAIKSMAQTRAQSRALRGVLAWIVTLAGYNPTPAEEMDGVERHNTARRNDPPPKPADHDKPITENAIKHVAIESRQLGFSDEDRHALIKELTGGIKSSTKDLTMGEARLVVQEMRKRSRRSDRVA